MQGGGAGEDARDREGALGSKQRRVDGGARQGQPAGQSAGGRAAAPPAAC